MVFKEKKRILIADDDEIIRSILCRYLTSLGFYSDTAESGFEALKLLDKNEYILLLIDYNMPGMDGAQLAEEVNKKHSSVYMAGITEKENHSKLYKAGVKECLDKPFSLNAIKKIVQEFDIIV